MFKLKQKYFRPIILILFLCRNVIYGELNNQRRVGSKERQERPVRRPAPQPPTQKVRRSSVDVLETSHSESESPRPVPDQVSRNQG